MMDWSVQCTKRLVFHIHERVCVCVCGGGQGHVVCLCTVKVEIYVQSALNQTCIPSLTTHTHTHTHTHGSRWMLEYKCIFTHMMDIRRLFLDASNSHSHTPWSLQGDTHSSVSLWIFSLNFKWMEVGLKRCRLCQGPSEQRRNGQ